METPELQNPGLLKDILSLTKPRLSGMVVITAACGMALALAATPLHPTHTLHLWGALFATAGIVGAANAFNCVLEADVDISMERTRNRPLPQGRLAPSTAMLFSLSLLVVSTRALYVFSNLLTVTAGLIAFFSYVGLYTPLKRRSMTALFVGAVPGALPPLMGWTAVTGTLSMTAWILFGILFFWQLPHFLAISIYRREEYESAGLKTVAGTLGVNAAGRHMFLYAALLFIVSLIPYPLGLAGTSYLAACLVLGLFFTGLAACGILRRDALNWPRAVFFGSLVYLPAVLGTWVIERCLLN